MKKRQREFFGFAVLLIAALFTLAGCGDTGGPTGTVHTDPLVISGTLSSVNSLSSSVFSGYSRAVAPDATVQTFSAELASDNMTLNGKLKDGSITFELSGMYDASTKVFSMQAPSSLMIFSIVGKLNAGNAIDAGSTSASVKLKDSATGEWTSLDLAVTSENLTVEGTVNADMSGVTYIPAFCRGILTDQIMALGGGNFRLNLTKNSITMYDGGNPPFDITVVEATNADGSPVDENGPWIYIIRGKYTYGYQSTEYTGKFYVSKTFDSKITGAVGNAPVNDLYWGEDLGTINNTPLKDAVSYLGSGIKVFVVPYCDTASVSTAGIWPADGYSPMFTGESATANARNATTLKAISGFVLALK